MARESRGVALVIGGGLALGLAGAGAYVFLVQPSVDRTHARAQIDAWETSWQRVRTCLIGAHPVGHAIAEQLATAELAASPADESRGCSLGIKELARPGSTDSGIDAVEAAWLTLEKATQQFAYAYPRYAEDTDGERVKLAAVLAELDRARVAVRTAAGLDPQPWSLGPELPAVVPARPLAMGGALENLAIQFHDGAAQLDGTTEGGARMIAIVRGASPPKIMRVPMESVRGLPDGTWAVQAAAGDGKDVIMGPVGEDGEVADGATKVLAPGDYFLHGAIGHGAQRVLYFEDLLGGGGDGPLRSASSPDDGKTWFALPSLPGRREGVVLEDWIDGALDVFVPIDDGGYRWTHDDAAHLDAIGKPIALPGLPRPADACLAGGSIWYVDDNKLATVAHGDVTMVGDLGVIEGCTRDHVIGMSPGGDQAVCDATGCRDTLPTAWRAGHAAVTADGGGALVVQAGGLLGVWRGARPMTAVRLPDSADVLALGELDGKLTVVLDGPSGPRLATLP